jgi:hypothetical protein
VTDKNNILNVDAFANERVAGNLAATAYTRIFLNLHKGANFRFVANLAPIQVDKLGKPHVLA